MRMAGKRGLIWAFVVLILHFVKSDTTDHSSKIGSVAAALPDPNREVIMSTNDLAEMRRKMFEANEKEEREFAREQERSRIFRRNRISCVSCKPPDCAEVKVCHGAVKCFAAQVRDVHGNVTRSKGCASDFQKAMLYCGTPSHDGREVHEKHARSSQYAFQCCKTRMCNNETAWPELPNVPVIDDNVDIVTQDQDQDLPDVIKLALVIVVPIIILVVLATIILMVMKSCHKRNMEELNKKWGNWLGWEMNNGASSDELLGLRTQPVGDSTLQEFKDDLTSGSGSGMPHLVQRTLAKQIRLFERIGKGRYGEVWKGQWNGDAVAVKIFFSRDEDSWKRETDIYSTVLLRHENILGYIGSDCTSQNSCTQLWLVTHFYHHGSLYDYLNNLVPGGCGSPTRIPSKRSLTSYEAYKILLSSLNGLVHLHTEIFGTRGKPAIAHRDVKSKNILVKNDGTCVIADFGLAVMHSQKTGQIDEHQNSRVGTKRYMSPEILDGSIENNKTFESYKRVDVYAFSLVMWEVLRRTRYNDSDPDSAQDYALPYHLDVGPDPSFDEMRKVVCTDSSRPEIPESWKDRENQFFSGLYKLMRECWHENPTVRLSFLRVKKSVGQLGGFAFSDPAYYSSSDFGSPTGGSRDYHCSYDAHGKLMNISRVSSGTATVTGTNSSGYVSKGSNSVVSTATNSASGLPYAMIRHPNQQCKISPPPIPYYTSIDEKIEENQT